MSIIIYLYQLCNMVDPMLGFIFLLLVNTVSVLGCPAGWITHGMSCYHVSRDIASWAEAQKMCEQHGSNLAHIETEPEDKFIANMLRNVHHGHDFWVSGSDWTTEGEWVWEPEGTPLLYQNWGHGQPNNSGFVEQCMAIRRIMSYKWSDEDCRNTLHYVCEVRNTDTVIATTEETLITPPDG